jgi:hypothetical protein
MGDDWSGPVSQECLDEARASKEFKELHWREAEPCYAITVLGYTKVISQSELSERIELPRVAHEPRYNLGRRYMHEATKAEVLMAVCGLESITKLHEVWR